MGQLSIPDVELDRDIGGYAQVKDRIRRETLDVLAYKDGLTDEAAVRHIESLIPAG